MIPNRHFPDSISLFLISSANFFIKKNILCLTVILALITGCGDGDPKSTVYMTNGQSYFDQGDYFMARLQFKQAIRIDPNIAEAYYNLGLTEVSLENIKQALGNFLRVIELDSDHIDAHIQIGQIMLKADFPEKAIERADLVLTMAKGHVVALKLKAAALLKLSPPSEKALLAQAILDQLIKESEATADTFYQSAVALLRQGKVTMAQVRAAEGLAKYPQDAPLHEILAKTYLRQGELANAIQTYQQLTTMVPNNPDYILALIKLLWETDQRDEAQRLTAQRMFAAGAKDPSVWIRLAQFYDSKNEHELSLNTLIVGSQSHKQSFELRLALARRLTEQKEYSTVIDRLYPKVQEIESRPGIQLDDAQLLLAKSFLALGEITQAEQYIDAFLENNPQNPDAHFTKGMIHLLNNDPHRAVSEFWAVLETNPSHLAGTIQLAHAISRTGQWQQAISILTRKLETSTHTTALHQALFRIYFRLKNYAQAEGQLDEIMKSSLENLPDLFELADAFRTIGAFDKAKQILRDITRKAPQNEEAYIQLSRLYIKEGNLNAAQDQLELGRRAIPASDKIAAMLTDTWIRNGKSRLALKYTTEKIEENPKDSFSYTLMGQAYIALREYGRAEKAFTEAIQLNPDASSAYLELMGLWYRQKKKEKIIDHYQTMIAGDPDRIPPYLALADYHLKERDYKAAIGLYEIILSIDPKNMDAAIKAIHLLCQHLHTPKDINAAMNIAGNALKYYPESPIVLDAVGWVYFHQKHFDKALGYLYYALDLDPGLTTALYHLAKANYQTGNLKAAQHNLKHYLERSEDMDEKKDAEKILGDIREKKQHRN